MGKITTEEVIKRCHQVHGERYDYSKVEYINTKTPITIICPQHGEFKQYFHNHLKGCGCPSCSNNKRKTTSEFVNEMKAKYPLSNIIYDKVQYINNHTPITFICPDHGEWETTASTANENLECPKCQKKRLHDKMAFTTEEFVEKARSVHGNRYDYSLCQYHTKSTPVDIICLKHGIFKQTPNNHLNGNNCPQCARLNAWDKRGKITTEIMIERFRQTHGDKYDYSKSFYTSPHTKITITCPYHGDFEQTPNSHWLGSACPRCGKENAAKKMALTTEEFIYKSQIAHGNKYDYSKVNYTNYNTKVEIICKKHGSYWQVPFSHMKGVGCPMCYGELSVSKNEIEFRNYIQSISDGEHVSFNVRNLISPLEIDIVNHTKKIAFEYDGLYWHSDLKLKDANYHLNKTKKCQNTGYQLIHVFEDEWLEKNEIVKSRIENILGKTPINIGARKCTISNISSKVTQQFLKENHIQGNVNASIRYGLFFKDELVAVMTFTKLRKSLGSKSKDDSYELVRFCNKLHTNIIGGASRLLKHFIKSHKPSTIISYADRRWSNGNMYLRLGFEHIHDSKPSYFYTLHGKLRENRFKYRKDVLVSQGFDKEKSESQIMKERGYNRIYDCGCMVFELKL